MLSANNRAGNSSEGSWQGWEEGNSTERRGMKPCKRQHWFRIHGGNVNVQHVKEDTRKKLQLVEDCLTKSKHLLEDVEVTSAESNAFAETETEKALCLHLEGRLSAVKKMQEEELEMTLALDKNRLI
ncbi:hypothetical protein ACRRTK_004513 [Alexandromys fortis]